MAKKSVDYPAILDDFGINIKKGIEELKKDSLKSALIADVIKIYGSIYWTQQLMAMSYNLQVANHNVLFEKLEASLKENEELKKRIENLEGLI